MNLDEPSSTRPDTPISDSLPFLPTCRAHSARNTTATARNFRLEQVSAALGSHNGRGYVPLNWRFILSNKGLGFHPWLSASRISPVGRRDLHRPSPLTKLFGTVFVFSEISSVTVTVENYWKFGTGRQVLSGLINSSV